MFSDLSWLHLTPLPLSTVRNGILIHTHCLTTPPSTTTTILKTTTSSLSTVPDDMHCDVSSLIILRESTPIKSRSGLGKGRGTGTGDTRRDILHCLLAMYDDTTSQLRVCIDRPSEGPSNGYQLRSVTCVKVSR